MASFQSDKPASFVREAPLPKPCFIPSSLIRILLGLFLFLAFRLVALLIIPPTGDEAIELYMADDIAHFRQFPVYFYQQNVLGTFESYFLAPFFRLFGLSLLGGRIYYSFFYFSFVAIYLWIVRRLFSRELTVYLFILLSILPFPALFFTTEIGRAEIPLLAVLSLALLLKMTPPWEGSVRYSLALGFVCGVAFWCNPLFLMFLIPIGIHVIWLIPRKNDLRGPFGFFLGFLVGLFPVWLHGLQTGTFMSVKDKGGAGFVQLGELPRVLYLFFVRMKYFFSTFSFGSVSPWVDGMIRSFSLIPFSIFAISYGSLLFHFFCSPKVFGLRERVFYSFMIVPPLVFAILYCSRNFTLRDEGMRFFVQLVIPYVFVVSWQLERLRSKFWKKVWLGLLIGVLLLGNFFSGREMIRRGGELRQLARFLEEERLHFGIADLGIAYPINLLTQHRVIATPLPHHAASRTIWESVKAGGPEFLILERHNPQLRENLQKDRNLKKKSIASYDIFYGKSDYLTSILDVQEPFLG